MKLVARLLLNKEIPVYKLTSMYNLPSNGYYFLIQVYGNMKGNIAMLFQFILPLLLVRLNICPCYFWWLIVFSSAQFSRPYIIWDPPFSPCLLLFKPTNIYYAPMNYQQIHILESSQSPYCSFEYVMISILLLLFMLFLLKCLSLFFYLQYADFSSSLRFSLNLFSSGSLP